MMFSNTENGEESIFTFFNFEKISRINVFKFDSLCSSYYTVTKSIVDRDTLAFIVDLLKKLPCEGEINLKFRCNTSFYKLIFDGPGSRKDTIDIVGFKLKTPNTSFYKNVTEEEMKIVELIRAE
jgi:hypothetical protein